MTSKNLNPRSTELLTATQMKGLLRLGDVVIPGVPARKAASTSGGGALPSFSESGCAAGIDRMLSYMYDDDRTAFQALAVVCAYAPAPLVRLIVAMANANAKFPEPLAGLMRMANLGIKGVVHSLYYSNLGVRLGEELTDSPLIARGTNPNQLPNIHQAIGYETAINQEAYEAALAAADAQNPRD
ncbi:hypothetical protein [Corynebacterium urealyticum]|uniref:hypothetical protein n=1 Tax=Corynebacterium urealyticum TaxID=43771 RepID=UPI0002B3FC02|nr:hypothetical protein [Corynebacterium urealyticum]AGE37509.1 hypothetical protein CU7111_1926 [Corynebacterium urealyticum DSM 7111]QQB07468.1 hypothetical protein I6H53_09400 [Corynebacterium urealyticum]